MKIATPDPFEGLSTPSRYKAYYGGRGAGKSHAFATELVLRGAQRARTILCCRETQVSIRDSVKRLLEQKIRTTGLAHLYASTKEEIRGLNGTLFLFHGLRANLDSIRSLEGVDIAWVEEAASLSQASLDILIPTIRKEGSEIWFSWNPRHRDDPVDILFRGKAPPPDAVIRRVNFDENPYFPAVLRREMRFDRSRDPDKYAWIWLGDYQRLSEARVFRNWTVERFEAPEGARFHYGADWGFSSEPTVLVRCFIDGRRLLVDAEAYAVGCDIDRIPALFDSVPGARRWPIMADGARPETIAYLRARGFAVRPARKGPGSVEDGIAFLQSHDIVVHPRCRHTIDELSLYAYKTDRLTGAVLPLLEDRKNHVIDALRYALEGVRRGASVIDCL
jgi:phage terminase large subunit